MARYRKNYINPKRFDRSQIKIMLILLPLALFMLLPIVFIFCHAFKPMDELFAYPPRFFVIRPTLDNFYKLFRTTSTSAIPIGRYVFNTFLVTLTTVTGSVFISTLAAFALSKLRFKGKVTLMEINNAALMFVPVSVMIPRYLIINALGLIDTYFALILPLMAMPVCLFLIKQFTDQVPDSLIEAAYIEGAGDFTVYRRIILPLIKPAVATGAILSFQQVWGDVMSSSYYISNETLRTLPFYMNTLTGAGNVIAGQGMAAAAGLVMFVPNLALFVILQSNVMNTMAHSGLK
ncbi:ABC transporter, permease protein [Thermoclostridium stercorarium subsp. stercorarium DSM 8532]|jgi:ABC-type glycerol-3-phosphate transport system permease component|uniref:ABC transporter, permease protein n=2 Tax=Thermoclostridium stercorarium TaxID=1510 RepID=L7VN68_THES1|nr:carbohydrate ABC transporter permease [Thermoclostridium stercorarium]AGC68114.1 ABC transporter, permease protein [Thermoclostridium stercorarium subsp. stercorarium DSM 8532]AGI39140.1 ABC transporter periplasmic subunit-2 [Thermoclostridium stercorarium subsp. stercorarium DSM 8532]ANX01029.1 ABC transporter permease [Thermoclostridium stercorarium subsp. leptospartum DSM 9219]UZQ86640.1 carbohydrate ABC transporter permease [Thermoclostridium stercorarium]